MLMDSRKNIQEFDKKINETRKTIRLKLPLNANENLDENVLQNQFWF